MSVLLSNINRQLSNENREISSPYWSDYFKHKCNPYFEIIDNNPNLVICYGDSWTWGDSLGQANARNGIEDTEFRSKNVYGYHLAQTLKADFVNLATPGIMNYWIHDRLNVLCNHDIDRLKVRYDKIYIVITLTELGRDFGFDHYIDDFRKFYNWTEDPDCTAETILIQAERYDFLKLQQIIHRLPENCHMIVGRNFTNTFDINQSILFCKTQQHLLPRIWTDVLFQPQNINPLTDVRIMSHGIDNFIKFIKDQQLDNQLFKDWFVNNLSISANNQIDFLRKSKYNYNTASAHPTTEGHQLWADYIMTYITSQGIL